MSIKIYNGFIIKKPIDESLIILNSSLDKLSKVQINYQVALLVNLTTKIFDRVYYSGEKIKINKKIADRSFASENTFLRFFKTLINFETLELYTNEDSRYLITEILRSKMSIHESIFDFSSKVYLYPFSDKTLLVPSFGNDLIKNAFVENPYIEDYHYQDNTDKPEDISDDEWLTRYNDWKKTGCLSKPISESLLSYQINIDSLGWLSGKKGEEEFLKTNLSFEKRSEFLTHYLKVEELANQNLEKHKQKLDLQKYLLSKEYKQDIEKNKVVIVKSVTMVTF